MEIYLKVIKEHYADFNGRARRQEYWMFALFNAIITVVLGVVDQLVGTGGFLGGIYGLAVLVPGIAVAVRRMHDIGKSGWLLLVALVPVVGWIIVLIWLIKEGDKGDNMFGADPKALENSTF